MECEPEKPEKEVWKRRQEVIFHRHVEEQPLYRMRSFVAHSDVWSMLLIIQTFVLIGWAVPFGAAGGRIWSVSRKTASWPLPYWLGMTDCHVDNNNLWHSDSSWQPMFNIYVIFSLYLACLQGCRDLLKLLLERSQSISVIDNVNSVSITESLYEVSCICISKEVISFRHAILNLSLC